MYIQNDDTRVFDWDDAKRLKTLEKHGIDFVRATKVFENPYLLLPATSDIEDRWVAIGRVDKVCIAVVFTMRATTTRMITARHARKNERQVYEAQNLSGNPQNGGPH